MSKPRKKITKQRGFGMWPCVAVKVGNKLFAQCSACDGTGHPMEWVSRSDRPGSVGRTLKKEQCDACKGRGYSISNEVHVVEAKR